MYLAHYGLDLKPFNINPDPRFLWFSETHKEALAALRYGIQENKGFLLLTGEVGTGKTVLIKHLIELVNVDARVATIPDPDLELMDFFNILADEFNMGRQFREKGEFLIHFKQFLTASTGDNRNLLLIIDEAQRLKHKLLDEIRVLSNLELHQRKVINIFLVGQNELKNILLEERNRAFRQRISVNYHIEPLSEQETSSYIEHRLKVAGASKSYFTADAIHEVHTFSNGFPRLINVICDHAMLSGYSGGFTMIDGATIKECAGELTLYADVTPPPLEQPPNIEYRLPDPEVETPASGEVPAASAKNPSYHLAFVLAFFIILSALPLLFFRDSVFETFLGWSGPKNELALTDGVFKIKPGLPDAVVNSRQDGDAALIVKPIVAKLPGDLTGEDTDVSRDWSNSKPADPETADISRAEGSGDQLIGKNELEKKFLVYFRKDSTELDSGLFETLTEIIDLLPLHPRAKILIEGYTDSDGDYFYNKKISQLRANIIKSYFTGQGIDDSRITALGKGPENPIADNATREGKSKNRRVEIRLTP